MISVVGVESVAVWGGVHVAKDEEFVRVAVGCCEVVWEDVYGCVVESSLDDEVREFEVVVLDNFVLVCEGDVVDDVVVFVCVWGACHGVVPFVLLLDEFGSILSLG